MEGSTRFGIGSMKLFIEASVGEVLDKFTILRIKQERIADPAKGANVARELESLETSLRSMMPLSEDVSAVLEELQEINGELWDIEDRIRDCERRQDFGETFVQLARQVYMTNDKRAALKRRLNESSGSALVEEKSYSEY